MNEIKHKRVASLFAGVGGIDLGFDELTDYKVVYANEFDKNARKTYELNFDLEVDGRDIREVHENEVPDIDVLLAGFPCQAFSVAGYRKGFEDERGDLFFETLRIIIAKKPEIVFLENVKNMVTHDEGNTFKVIRQGLEQNGYYLKWAVLNAKDYANIPQNRERIYIVAFRSKEAFDQFYFPEPIHRTSQLNDFISFNKKVHQKYYYTAEKNPSFYDELEKEIISQETVYQWRRKYVRKNMSGVVPTLTANMGTGGHNVPLILADHGIRKLTPRETFNIQGFPESFELPTDMADGPLYKQAGNSVVVPLIQRIANNITKALNTSVKKNRNPNPNKPILTFTRMFGSNIGESYAVSNCETKEKVEVLLKESMRPLLNEEQYKRIIKEREWNEFYMLN